MKKPYFSLRHVIALVLLLTAFIIYSCRKEIPEKAVVASSKSDKNAALIADAKTYLDSALKTNSTIVKLSSTESNSTATTFNGYLFWDKAQSFLNKNFEVVEIPAALDYRKVSFYKLGGDTSNYITDKLVAETAFTRVLIFRDSTQKIMDKRIITYIPDKSYLFKNANPSSNNWINNIDKDYSGYIEYRTWENVPYLVLRLTGGKVKANYKLTPQNNSTNLGTQGLKTNSWTCNSYSVPDMVTVCAFGSCDTHDNGTSTIYMACYETPDGYSPEPTFDSGNTSTSPGGSGNGTTSPTISNADIASATYVDDGKPPINPTKYINCFTDGKTASQYKMTLYVDQPNPGNNDQFTIPISYGLYGFYFLLPNGIKLDVGHAFVGFQKLNTDGTSVTQVMGFYPGSHYTSAKGVIKDDGGHEYSVSYTSTVSASQFNSALNSLSYDNSNSYYRLSNGNNAGEYNCTDAGIIWMTSAGINLPGDTPRNSFTNTPGDYGQALRNFNGTNTTPGYAPSSHGACN